MLNIATSLADRCQRGALQRRTLNVVVTCALSLAACDDQVTTSAVTTAPFCSPGGAEICGDGLDNNCDGQPDEGCPCDHGAVQSCYPGDALQLSTPRSACRLGRQTCDDGRFGPCEGAQGPAPELCDGLDNDCDGELNEDIACDNSPPTVQCPEDQVGAPLSFFDLSADYRDPDGGAPARVRWRLIDKPRGTSAQPAPPNALDTRIFADLQGRYVLELKATDAMGASDTCRTTVETISDDGLRIEMVWNIDSPEDDADVDLHLMKQPDGQWFEPEGAQDDCFWRNCRVCADQSETFCREKLSEDSTALTPRLVWFPPSDDDDPRLDLDDVQGYGPENINIRAPRDGRYRVGVHYWHAHESDAADVVLRIYCRGALAREFEPVTLHAPGGFGGDSTEFWEVADIVWAQGRCHIDEIGAPHCRQICPAGLIRVRGHCHPDQRRGDACP